MSRDGPITSPLDWRLHHVNWGGHRHLPPDSTSYYYRNRWPDGYRRQAVAGLRLSNSYGPEDVGLMVCRRCGGRVGRDATGRVCPACRGAGLRWWVGK